MYEDVYNDEHTVLCKCCMKMYGAENNNLSGQCNLCYDCEEDMKNERKDFLNELMDSVMDFWIDYNYSAGRKGYENREEYIYETA